MNAIFKLHPAVAQTLRERVLAGSIAKDMKPEDWKGLRDGFLKWTAEEEAEPEHAEIYDAATFDAEFKEGDHPRAPDGKFGSGGGSTTAPKPLTMKSTPAEREAAAAASNKSAEEIKASMAAKSIEKAKSDPNHLGKLIGEALGNQYLWRPEDDGSIHVKFDDIGPKNGEKSKKLKAIVDGIGKDRWDVTDKGIYFKPPPKAEAIGAGAYKTAGKPSWNGGTHDDPAKMETPHLESSATALQYAIKNSPFTNEQRARREERLADISAELKKRQPGKTSDEELAATDSALTLALDRDSVREKDHDGRMKVKIANISKATVNPYLGEEIPGWEELGLEPKKIYQMLRDPAELEKAASTFNGVQLLKKHIPVNAEDHQPYDVVGTTGTDAKFENPFLTNSLHVWTKDAIDEIESDGKKELSCGYHYRPDMTPGRYEGMRYDGVMREIVGNHVALVKDGRAGPDVVVGDSVDNLEWAILERELARFAGIH